MNEKKESRCLKVAKSKLLLSKLKPCPTLYTSRVNTRNKTHNMKRTKTKSYP